MIQTSHEKTEFLQYRRARLLRMQELVSASTGDPGQWRELEEKFKTAHQENPELSVWMHMNESPLPEGPGSLHFRELAKRAASAFAPSAGENTWKVWLDVVLGYLLKNDASEEYLHTIQVGHLEQPDANTCESELGTIRTIVQGESYRIDRLLKASELCCAWLKLIAFEKQLASERTVHDVLATPEERSLPPHCKELKDDNPLLQAMRAQGLNAPRLATQVRRVLKRRGVTSVKVDRTTIYRLVNGKTKLPNPIIRSAVLEVLRLSDLK